MMDEKTDFEEDSLIDLLRVLIKKKYKILSITIGVAVIFLILSVLTPKIYETTTVIEVGTTPWGILDNLVDLKAKIDNGAYGEMLKDRSQTNKTFKITTEVPKDSRLLTMKINSSDPEGAKKYLEEINKLILEEHQEKVKMHNGFIDKDIETVEKKINALEAEKKNLEAKIKVLENSISSSVLSQIALSYFQDKLNSEEQQIQELSFQRNNFQKQKEAIEPTKVVKEPTSSSHPIRPDLKINTIFGLIIGLFLGIFWAFFDEYWQKNKNPIKTY
jgi:uncharacterized protein involved in exopolysaccharide biosynthesis